MPCLFIFIFHYYFSLYFYSYFYLYFYFYYNLYLYFYSILDISSHNCRPYQSHEKLNFIMFYSILPYYSILIFSLRKHHSEFRARRILNFRLQILQEILYRSIPRIREEFKGKNNTRNNIREWVRKRI